MRKDWARQHEVYRAYNNEGELLYVGCTMEITKRLKDWRAQGAAWTHQATTIDVEVYPDYHIARSVEATVIQQERPLYNIAQMAKQTTAGIERAKTDPLEYFRLPATFFWGK